MRTTKTTTQRQQQVALADGERALSVTTSCGLSCGGSRAATSGFKSRPRRGLDARWRIKNSSPAQAPPESLAEHANPSLGSGEGFSRRRFDSIGKRLAASVVAPRDHEVGPRQACSVSGSVSPFTHATVLLSSSLSLSDCLRQRNRLPLLLLRYFLLLPRKDPLQNRFSALLLLN